MQTRDQIYIDGEWVTPSGSTIFDVINATTEEVMGRIRGSAKADVDRAVAAARAAFEPWSSRPVAERAAFLDKLQAGLLARTDEIARLVSMEVGTPLSMAKRSQAGSPAFIAGVMANLAREYKYEEAIGNSLVVREPIGVVGCITPWNFPLLQALLKIAPALAAGCTVVLKPSEIAPLSAYILAEVIHAIELPKGVFNLLSGDGPTVGEALAAHPGIDMVSFTGSTRAGRRVSEVAAGTIKRVTLELGGKSANLILDDADLQKAVTAGVRHCYLNGGQACIAWSRMLVPRGRYAEAVALAKTAAEAIHVGDPLAEGTHLGPLVSATQRDRVRSYIAQGQKEGARLVTGGADAPEGLPQGYFVRPTVFADVTPDMTIARDEIFGPVLSILPYDTEEQAIAIANDTIYGLSGSVWSQDAERAKRVARRIRTGQISVNGAAGHPLAPFGGYKQSGNGREMGRHGFEEFLETKSIQT